jgi:beta-galactosidase
MTATNLNTSTWQTAVIGQDVFNGRVGYAWFRALLDALATSGRPLALHFVSVDDNASVYLNGILLGQHTGGAQPFDIAPVDAAWVTGGPNILAVAIQNVGGPGGILAPASLQSGNDVVPPDPRSNAQGPAAPNYDDSAWRTVHLPHDYIVEGTFTNTADRGHGYLPLTTAWYRQTFTIPASAQSQSIWIDFDGIYHNSTVWLNGYYLGNWWSGYAPVRYDITPFAICGGTNVLAVHVDPSGFEGWWYEGGGIYRHVWLNSANNLHVAPWGTFVATAVHGPDMNGNASTELTITTTVTNAAAQPQACILVSQIVGPEVLRRARRRRH